MGRRAGGHAYGDSLGAVDEEIGELHRQDGRLLLRLVEIRDEIHHVLVQIRQIGLLGHFLQPCLRVTHGSGAVSLNVAKVSVSVHKGQALLEILSHDHQGVINGTVPVRMVLTHGIAYDTGTFSVRPVVADTQFIHVVKGAPLHRLQAVPNVRERTGDDDAHGVINERFLHLLGIFCFDDSIIVHLVQSFSDIWSAYPDSYLHGNCIQICFSITYFISLVKENMA